MEMIVPLYSHLTRILVRKAQQPDESSIDKWSLDDLEAFRCYREDISDTLVELIFKMHKQNIVKPFMCFTRCTAMRFYMKNYWIYWRACWMRAS